MKVDDEFVSSLLPWKNKLEYLSLQSSGISQDVIPTLVEFRKLNQLNVKGIKLDAKTTQPKGVAELFTHLPTFVI